MKRLIKRIYQTITARLDEIILLFGLASICIGLWQIYPPLAWIFGGGSLVFIAFLRAKP